MGYIKSNERYMNKKVYREMLHSAGLRATPGRLLVLEHLHFCARPVSVADVERSLREKSPNLVTLYRMMQDFLSARLVRCLDLGQGCDLYEAVSGSHHHHHIVCTQCGYVEDISGCIIKSSIETAKTKSKNFGSITEHNFELFGLCKKCS